MTDHEQLPSSEIPTASEISAAYSETLDHNKKHSGLGAAFATVLKATLKNAKELDSETSEDIIALDEAIDEEKEATTVEGEMNASILDLMNENLFAKIGVKIYPSGGNTGNLTMSELKPHLIPLAGGLYADFLKTLARPEDASINRLLTDIDGSLARELHGAVNNFYEFQDEAHKEEFIQSRMQTFEPAIDEYERLGIDTKTGEYVKRWGQGVLAEYIEADKIGMLTDFPKVWHLDGTKYNWMDVIPYLARLEQDERTQPLAEELKEHLAKLVDESISELDTDESQKYAIGARPSLVEINKLLRGQDYDAALIMDWWEKPAY